MRRKGDQAFKSAAEEDARGLLAMAGRLPLSVDATVTPLERELTREPLLVDHAYHIRSAGREWVEHLEAFSRYPADAAERLAEYAQEIAVKTKLAVYSTAVLLLQAYDPGRVARSGWIVRGAVETRVRFQVVKLWRLPAGQLLASGRPYLLPWVALCRCRESELAEANRRMRNMDARLEPRIRAMFQTLGGLRYGKEVWRAMLEERAKMFLKREIIEESPFVQDLLKEREEQAEARGEARGEAKGTAAAFRLAIRELVTALYPALAPELRALDRIKDASVLQALIRELVQARNAGAARKLLQSRAKRRA